MPSSEDKYNPPKRNRTAYNLFYQSARKRILDSIPDSATPRISKGRKTHGKISFQGLAKRVGQEWSVLPPQEKEVYFEMARKDKERYLREKEKWQESIAELERQYSSEPLDYSIIGLPEKTPPKKRAKVALQKTVPLLKACSLRQMSSVKKLPVAYEGRLVVQPLRLPQIDCGIEHEASHSLNFGEVDMEPLPISYEGIQSLQIPCLGFQQPFTAVERWSFKRMLSKKLDKSSVDFLVSNLS